MRCPGKKWSLLLDSYQFTIQWNTMALITQIINVIRDYQDTFGILKIIRPNSFMYYAFGWSKSILPSYLLDKIKMDPIKGNENV